MKLRGPAMNRSLNRRNPDVLVVMIAEKQIMRGNEEDKGDQFSEMRDRGMGPLKAATDMSGTAALKSNVLLTSLGGGEAAFPEFGLLVGDNFSATDCKVIPRYRTASAARGMMLVDNFGLSLF
ncbi:unnamed protein product [Ilex paraguariensis]|uniref:Uncharacterized protein n=1 Tax=Ilex paraguariensis TaxID=185542 RepID=A0ABC8UGC9_9AQUA